MATLNALTVRRLKRIRLTAQLIDLIANFWLDEVWDGERGSYVMDITSIDQMEAGAKEIIELTHAMRRAL